MSSETLPNPQIVSSVNNLQSTYEYSNVITTTANTPLYIEKDGEARNNMPVSGLLVESSASTDEIGICTMRKSIVDKAHMPDYCNLTHYGDQFDIIRDEVSNVILINNIQVTDAYGDESDGSEFPDWVLYSRYSFVILQNTDVPSENGMYYITEFIFDEAIATKVIGIRVNTIASMLNEYDDIGEQVDCNLTFTTGIGIICVLDHGLNTPYAANEITTHDGQHNQRQGLTVTNRKVHAPMIRLLYLNNKSTSRITDMATFRNDGYIPVHGSMLRLTSESENHTGTMIIFDDSYNIGPDIRLTSREGVPTGILADASNYSAGSLWYNNNLNAIQYLDSSNAINTLSTTISNSIETNVNSSNSIQTALLNYNILNFTSSITSTTTTIEINLNTVINLNNFNWSITNINIFLRNNSKLVINGPGIITFETNAQWDYLFQTAGDQVALNNVVLNSVQIIAVNTPQTFVNVLLNCNNCEFYLPNIGEQPFALNLRENSICHNCKIIGGGTSCQFYINSSADNTLTFSNCFFKGTFLASYDFNAYGLDIYRSNLTNIICSFDIADIYVCVKNVDNLRNADDALYSANIVIMRNGNATPVINNINLLLKDNSSYGKLLSNGLSMPFNLSNCSFLTGDQNFNLFTDSIITNSTIYLMHQDILIGNNSSFNNVIFDVVPVAEQSSSITLTANTSTFYNCLVTANIANVILSSTGFKAVNCTFNSDAVVINADNAQISNCSSLNTITASGTRIQISNVKVTNVSKNISLTACTFSSVVSCNVADGNITDDNVVSNNIAIGNIANNITGFVVNANNISTD